jgi:hypothetical protein
VEHIDSIFPNVYNIAKDGMSPFVSEKLESMEMRLPAIKHPQNPYHRCVHVRDGIHPSSALSKIKDIYNKKKIHK